MDNTVKVYHNGNEIQFDLIYPNVIVLKEQITESKQLKKEPIPLYHTADNWHVYEKDTYPTYRVHRDWFILQFAACDADPSYNPERLFHSKEKAEEYIERYKPVLSFSDIANEVNYSSDSQQSLLIRLKELIKSKI